MPEPARPHVRAPRARARGRAFRLVGVLAVYLGASWLVLYVARELAAVLGLPGWAYPVTFLLLLAGLVVVMVTAWVQFHPATAERAAREEVPDPWELALGELAESLRERKVPHPTWSRALLGGAVAFSLLVGFAAAFALLRPRPAAAPAPRAAVGAEGAAVAVLPFAAAGTGAEAWREGLADLVALGLDGAGGVRAVDRRAVSARWRAATPAEGEPALPEALRVARESGARIAVLGRVVPDPAGVAVTVEVHDAREDRRLERLRIETPGGVSGLVPAAERVAAAVLAVLLGTGGDAAPGVGLARAVPGSSAALHAFLEGETRLRLGETEVALRALERAVAADTGFALAWHRLALARRWAGGGAALGETLALGRALAFPDRLPRRTAVLARAALDARRFLPRAADSLLAAVARWPDDPEAWYLLGEARRAGLAPETPERAREAFERAAELDPGFAPYLLPLADLALRLGSDSAAAGEIVERYARLAPARPETRELRVALALAHGDPPAAAAARAALDTADLGLVARVAERLAHPRLWPAREDLYRLVYLRGDAEAKGAALAALVRGEALARGRLEIAQRVLQDPATPELVRTCALYEVHSLVGGLPLPLLEAGLAGSPRRPPPPAPQAERAARLVCLAQYAAERGRWAEYERLRADHAALASSAWAAGDTVSARELEAMDRWLDGWKLWVRGQRPEALGRFESARADGAPAFRRRPGRLWMGRLLLEAGRPRDALAHFRSLDPEPVAALHAGRAHLALGDTVAAAAAYAGFLAWWEQADAALRGLVEEARTLTPPAAAAPPASGPATPAGPRPAPPG